MGAKNLERISLLWETSGELVKKLEAIPENERDFHQNLLLAFTKQYHPDTRISSIPIKIRNDDTERFLKNYRKFKKESNKHKIMV